MNYLNNASSAVQAFVGVVMALYVLFSALSLLLGVLATWFPKLLPWAQKCSDVGMRLHEIGLKIGAMLPGGNPPAAVKMASRRPSPACSASSGFSSGTSSA